MEQLSLSNRPSAQLGRAGEEAVAQHLIREGFAILQRNYRQRCGEIDLIAQKEDLLAFVEIKTRRKEHFALTTLITKAKQRKIINTARHFILAHKPGDYVLRFDIATVLEKANQYEITHIPNAFTANY